MNSATRNGELAMVHALLSEQFAVGARMRNCRWNATGKQELRNLFASHDAVLGQVMNEIAERALAAGKKQTAAVAAFLSLVRTKAHPDQSPRATEITSELMAGHNTVIGLVRENLEQCAGMRREFITTDFLSGVIEKHEKMAAELLAVCTSQASGESPSRVIENVQHLPPSPAQKTPACPRPEESPSKCGYSPGL